MIFDIKPYRKYVKKIPVLLILSNPNSLLLILLPADWQKEKWQNFEETSGHVRPERLGRKFACCYTARTRIDER
jgi:hypothetical protein